MEDKISYIKNIIPEYGGYKKDVLKDLDIVSKYIIRFTDRFTRFMMSIKEFLPPDSVNYLHMSFNILNKIKSDWESTSIPKDPELNVVRLVDYDYNIIKILESIGRIMENIKGGVSRPVLREYISIIFKLSIKLKEVSDGKKRIISSVHCD